jgi:hypothetical protein
VPRYFFIIQSENVVIEDDPHGSILPDTAAALSYAERTIRELRGEGGYNELRIMIVKDESKQTVLSLPFLPACA